MSSHSEHLAQQVKQAEERLAKLKERAGLAQLQGEAPPNEEIVSVERLIENLRAAQGALSKREREDEARQAEEIGDRLRAELLQLEERRLEAVAQAEAGLRAFVESINAVSSISTDMVDVCSRLRTKAPSQLSAPATASRMGQTVVAVLSTIKGHPRRYGSLEWIGSVHKPDADWASVERKALASALAIITEGESMDIPTTPSPEEEQNHDHSESSLEGV